MALRENVGITLHRWLAADENAEAFCGLDGEGVRGQALAGFVTIFRRADDVDEVIEMAQRQQISFEVFGTVLGFAEEILGTTNDHFTTVLDVAIDGVFQREHLRTLLVNGKHVHAIRCVHAGEFENLIRYDMRTSIALQLNLDARFFVRKVAHAGDAGENFFIHQFRDTFLQSSSVHSVRDFANGENRLATFLFINVDFTTQTHGATTGAEVFFDALEATNFAFASEVRAFDILHQFRQGDVWLIDLCADGVNNFAQVVRCQVCCHTHSDTGATID